MTTTVEDNRPPQLKEIETNYIESFQFLRERKRRQVNQLILLNNLQRGDENIASTLLLTLFNRVLSNLYDDKLQVKFLPTQGITQDQLNSYNILAQSDYQEMNKAKLDYDWVWDTLFFGRGYCETYAFDKKKKLMKPQIINPLVFGYDPYFENVQDWRYYWKWITKNKWDIEKLIKDGTIDGITSTTELDSGIDPFLYDYKLRRDRAKKAIEPTIAPMSNDVFQILEYYGYDENGDKCCYWVDKSFSKQLMKEKLDLQDGEDGESNWPIVVKEAFREPHATVNFSVADLLEDKHRARSVLLNLAFIAAKDKANPLYMYNPDKVKDVTQLFQRQINQHIPVNDMNGAIAPLNVEEPMSTGLMSFMQLLNAEAENPTGSGQATRQPGQGRQATAAQVAIETQLNQMAFSLQSKIVQFGEQEFWSKWFHRYARYADELKSKVANIVGVKGVNSTEIDLKDFNTDFPPGVLIYSAKDAEAKELVQRNTLTQIYPELAQTLDADGMRNFQKFVYFPKLLQDPSLVDIMLPKTLDEMHADAENEQLVKDTMPDVKETDNHTTHIYTHHMVQPKTWATWMHIAWHEELLDKQKAQQQGQGGQQGQQKVSESIGFKDLPPDGQVQMAQQAGIKIAPPQPQQQNQQQTPAGSSQGAPNAQSKQLPMGKQKKNPLSMTAPLKTEMNRNLAGNLQ
jgi:hypothetical protein